MVGKKPILKVKKILKTELEETKIAFKEKTVTLILSGLGLVAALAWNDAIQSVFATYLKKTNEIIGKFIYALIVTTIIVFLSRSLEKLAEKKNN